MPISLLNLSRYSSLANICLSKTSLHLGAWSYHSKGSISRGYNWIFITIKYNNINGGISIIHVCWSSQRPTFFQEHITHQFGTLTKLQATNEALFIGVLLYQAVAVGNMHIRSGKLNGSTSFTIYNMHYVNFRIQV